MVISTCSTCCTRRVQLRILKDVGN
jgi:hypothetical protein